MSLEVVSVSGSAPVTVAECLAHCGLADDATARATPLVEGAIATVETQLRRVFRAKSFKLRIPAFPDVIRMAPPTASVSAVKYFNQAGTLTTLSTDTYLVDLKAEPGTISLAPGKQWPVTAERLDAVLVEYSAGGVAPTSDVKAAILLQFEQLFDGQDDQRARTIQHLLEPRIEPIDYTR